MDLIDKLEKWKNNKQRKELNQNILIFDIFSIISLFFLVVNNVFFIKMMFLGIFLISLGNSIEVIKKAIKHKLDFFSKKELEQWKKIKKLYKEM